jgi:hypothetical protein
VNEFCLTKKEIASSKKNHSIRLVSIIKREKPAPKGAFSKAGQRIDYMPGQKTDEPYQ